MGQVLGGLPNLPPLLNHGVFAFLRKSLFRIAQVAPSTTLLMPMRLVGDPLGSHRPEIEFNPVNPVHLLLAGGIKFFLEFESGKTVLKISDFVLGANICLPQFAQGADLIEKLLIR